MVGTRVAAFTCFIQGRGSPSVSPHMVAHVFSGGVAAPAFEAVQGTGSTPEGCGGTVDCLPAFKKALSCGPRAAAFSNFVSLAVRFLGGERGGGIKPFDFMHCQAHMVAHPFLARALFPCESQPWVLLRERVG